MAFMHYPPLDEIDWGSVAGPNIRKLVLCRPVFDELDRNKDANPQTGVKKRLRNLLGLIVDKIDTNNHVPLRQGLCLKVLLADPEPLPQIPGLSSDRTDDFIVLLASLMNGETPGSVAIVSHDTKVRIHAKRLGIPVIVLPAAIRFKERDETQEKLNEIRREQLRKPSFHLSVNGPNNIAEFVLPIVAPYEHQPLLFFDPLLSAADRPQFKRDMEKYELALRDHEELTKRLMPLQLRIMNAGTATATTLKIRLEAPPGSRFYTEDQLPKAPERPKSSLDWLKGDRFGAALDHLNLGSSREGLLGRSIREALQGQPSGPQVSIDGQNVLIEVRELLHHFEASFDGLLLSIHGQEEHIVQIPVLIYCAQLVEPKELSLVVKIQNEPQDEIAQDSDMDFLEVLNEITAKRNNHGDLESD